MLRSLSLSLSLCTVVDEHEIKLEFRVQVISLSANPEQSKLVTSKKYIVLRPQNYLRHFLKLPFFPTASGKSRNSISLLYLTLARNEPKVNAIIFPKKLISCPKRTILETFLEKR